MPEGWRVILLGAGFILVGLFATGVKGAMPGSKTASPMPRRLRVILIAYGTFTIILGVFRLQ